MSRSVTAPSTTTAFYAQSGIAFAVAVAAVLLGIWNLSAGAWERSFMALGTLFLITSTFTLAKCVRDAQETSQVVHRLDQARVDKILAEHDPFAQV